MQKILTQILQFSFILGLTDLLWPVLCHRPSWSFMLFVYIFGLQQVVHVIELCVRPSCSRLFVFCYKHHTLSSCHDWLCREVVLMGNICSEFLNWETFSFFNLFDPGKVWKCHLGKVVYIGRIGNILVKFWNSYLEKVLFGNMGGLLESIILGKFGESWENSNLGKCYSKNLGLYHLGKSCCL